MKQRDFIELASIAGLGGVTNVNVIGEKNILKADNSPSNDGKKDNIISNDFLIVGAGLGGVACALALLRDGYKVIMTEETNWVGGQLTSQGVPPDEHKWIETYGSPGSYRKLRQSVREYYQILYPLKDEQKSNSKLNPGNAFVSRLSAEPKVYLAVLENMLAPFIFNAQLVLLMEYVPISADTQNNFVKSVVFKCKNSNRSLKIEAKNFVDATELGDLLPLTGTEYVTGSESKKETNELHAPEISDPFNNQAFTTYFALDYVPGEDFSVQPSNYEFWSSYEPRIDSSWSGKLLSLMYSDPKTLSPKALCFDPRGTDTDSKINLWNYRKVIDRNNFEENFYTSDITIVNWPQNDYLEGNIIDVSEEEFQHHIEASKELGLSLLYWMQTEVPRANGKKGWPGIRLRKDIMGTDDGFAKYPYVREARRIKTKFTILEGHVGVENRKKVAGNTKLNNAKNFTDSVGIGYYHINLHPTQKSNYIDFPSLRFQISLGALLPKRVQNIFPANKNIGTTHITNGCYRLHPVEWSIGEAVGLALVFSEKRDINRHDIYENKG